MNKKTPIKPSATMKPQASKTLSQQKSNASASNTQSKPQEKKSDNSVIQNTKSGKNSVNTSTYQTQNTKSSAKQTVTNKKVINNNLNRETSVSSINSKVSTKSMSKTFSKSTTITKATLNNQKLLEENKSGKSIKSVVNSGKMKLDDLKQSQDISKNLGLVSSTDLEKLLDRKESNSDVMSINELANSSKFSDIKNNPVIEETKDNEDLKGKPTTETVPIPIKDNNLLSVNNNNGRRSRRNGPESHNSPEITESNNNKESNKNSPIKEIINKNTSKQEENQNVFRENPNNPSLVHSDNNQKDQSSNNQNKNLVNFSKDNSNNSANIPANNITDQPVENNNKSNAEMTNITKNEQKTPFKIKTSNTLLDNIALSPIMENSITSPRQNSISPCRESFSTPIKQISFPYNQDLNNDQEQMNMDVNKLDNQSKYSREITNNKQKELNQNNNLTINKTASNNFQIFETLSKIDNEYTVKSTISIPEDQANIAQGLNINEQIKILKKYSKNLFFKLPFNNRKLESGTIYLNLQNLKERLNKGLNYQSSVTFSNNKLETTNEKDILVYPVNEKAFSPRLVSDGAEMLKRITSAKKLMANFSPIIKHKSEKSLEEDFLETIQLNNLVFKNEKLSKIKEELLDIDLFSERNEIRKSFNNKSKVNENFPHLNFNDLNRESSKNLKENEGFNNGYNNSSKANLRENSRYFSPQVKKDQYSPFHNTKYVEKLRESFSTAKLEESKYDKFYKQSFKKVFDDIEKKRFSYNIMFNQLSRPSDILSDLKNNIVKMKNQYNKIESNRYLTKASFKGKDSFTFERAKFLDNKLVDRLKRNITKNNSNPIFLK